MPKYAIVVTSDPRYLAGVNGQLNAMKYYGMDKDVEFHLVHQFPKQISKHMKLTNYIEQVEKAFPFFRSIEIDDYMMSVGRWDSPQKKGKSVMKYLRWWYPADMLKDYDAICIMDADRQIVNNFTRYFDMIAKSDMIGLAKNDYSDAEWFSYDEKRAMQAQPPLYSNPYFITGARAAELFPLIPKYAENPQKYSKHTKKPQTGDMHPVNLTLLHTGMIKDLFPLPASQWVFVETTHVKLARRIIAKKQYIGMHPNGDLLHTFHRRYWGQRVCERFMNGHGPITRINGVNNTRLFWEFTKFFNTELYLKLEWIWGEFPSQPLSGAAQRWLDQCIRNMDRDGETISGQVHKELSSILEQVKGGRFRLSKEALALVARLGVPALKAVMQRY